MCNMRLEHRLHLLQFGFQDYYNQFMQIKFSTVTFTFLLPICILSNSGICHNPIFSEQRLYSLHRAEYHISTNYTWSIKKKQ